MNIKKETLAILGAGIIIGVVITVILLMIGATPSKIEIGPVEFDITAIRPTNTSSVLIPDAMAFFTSSPPTSTPTSTPTPTVTPIPPTPTPTFTPTPVPPDTQSGSTLRVDEVWRQEGMRLAIESHRFYAGYCTDHWSCFESCCIQHAAAIAIEFTLINETGQDVLLDFDQSHFSIWDNTGKAYPVAQTMEVGSNEEHTDEVSVSFRNGQRYRIYIMFGADTSIDPQATRLFVKVTSISRIKNAIWAIDVPR